MYKLESYLNQSGYDKSESKFLLESFRQGFDLGYKGPMNRQDFSQNLPFNIHNRHQLWNKVMDEVGINRFASPFELNNLPFSKTIVQSPIGLVPKAGNKTRLIFHLSYNFKSGHKSINFWTPKELSSVKYNDLDKAVHDCIELMRIMGVNQVFYSKSDLQSAFRVLPGKISHRALLVMKAQHPESGIWYFFIDKCMPFGASISCSHFQRFSNALKFIVEWKANQTIYTLITNYLDNFLFIYITQQGCNTIVLMFLGVCEDINFPVALDRTEWANTVMVFLGMLLNGKTHTLSIPEDKRQEALNMV